MIRDPIFNPVYRVQPAPWGAEAVCKAGYLIALSAVHANIPADDLHGNLGEITDPEETLIDYLDEVVLVGGTWCPVRYVDTPSSVTFLTPSTPAFALPVLGDKISTTPSP